MKVFGERLKELRVSNKLSILALSKLINISDATICRWENNTNDIKAEQLVVVANFFAVSTDFLLGLED